MRAAAGACNFRTPLANDVPIGVILPTQTGNVVATIALRFQCTQGDAPSFALSGINDSAGVHRMRNLTYPTQYLPYSTTAVLTNPTTYSIAITVSEADYRAAWIGDYEDTLLITISP